MADMEPVAASHEAGRSVQAERLAESREREARAERAAPDTTTERTERPRQERGRDDVAAPGGERVSVQSGDTVRAVEAPRSTSEARELARETRMRMEQSPDRAIDSVQDTAQEPASSRISRAIDAMN